MQDLIEIVAKLPVEAILQWLAAAGVLSIVLQKLKTWLSLQSSRVINFLNALMSGAVILIENLLNAATQNPSLIPSKALGLMSLTILVYSAPCIGVKSLSQLFSDAKAERERRQRVNVTTEPIETQNLAPEPAAIIDAPDPDVPVSIVNEETEEFLV